MILKKIKLLAAISFVTISCSSCSEDITEENIDPIETKNGDLNGSVLMKMGDKTILDNQELYLGDTSIKTNPNENLLYISFKDDLKDTNKSMIPYIDVDKNLKVYYSRSKNLDDTIIIHVEKLSDSESYGSPITLKNLEIIALNPVTLRKTQLKNKDLKNYQSLIYHFSPEIIEN